MLRGIVLDACAGQAGEMTRTAGLLPALLILMPLPNAAPARAEPDSALLLCGKAVPALPRDGGAMPAAAVLAGDYRCREEGIAITLRLTADARFEQRIESDEALDTDEDGAEVRRIDLRGRWRLEEGALHLFAQPQRAPVLRLIDGKRDPAVRMRVEIRAADGAPARGLIVAEGEGTSNVSAFDHGVLLVPLSYSWTPGLRQVVRASDALSLTRFTVGPSGPNSFRFEYAPSEVEPFDQHAMVVDANAGAVVVPLGIGAAVLRRVDGQRSRLW